MASKTRILLLLVGALLLAAPLQAADLTASLKAGTPKLQSAGPLAFGPDGVLFVADTRGASIFAIDTGDRTKGESGFATIPGIGKKIAALLGTSPRDIRITDLAVNPASGRPYLAVARGQGPQAIPVLLRVGKNGRLEEFSLKNVRFAKASLPNPPAPGGEGRRNRRAQSITDLAFVEDRVLVAGLSNEEFASNLRSIPFPFTQADAGSNIEIYHGAHGRFETRSPIRTFVPFNIGGEPHILAAYTCTPLVKFPVAQLLPGSHLKGVTIAELGNRNRPLDMIVYKKAGKPYLLMANSARGVMKITTDHLGRSEGITEKVGDTAGQAYETIEGLKGVQHLDRLDATHAIILAQADDGSLNLESIALP